jgi:predicted RNA-binding protein with RPS1 domain
MRLLSTEVLRALSEAHGPESDQVRELRVGLRPVFPRKWEAEEPPPRSKAELLEEFQKTADRIMKDAARRLRKHEEASRRWDAVRGSVRAVKALLAEMREQADKIVKRAARRFSKNKEASGVRRGDVVRGSVRAVKPYGAFVEFDGGTGLLHISQISREYVGVEHLGGILRPGSEIRCVILGRDERSGRVSLATSPLEATAGDMLRDPKLVFNSNEETAALYLSYMEAERRKKKEAGRRKKEEAWRRKGREAEFAKRGAGKKGRP